MLLTLTLCNAEALQNDQPTEIVLDKQEAMIGRSPACDWSLPDPDKFVSSRHGKISYSDEGYVFNDLSTNGTFLNGSVEKMAREHRIADGDVFQIGRYQIRASLKEDTKTKSPSPGSDANRILPGSSAAPAPKPIKPEEETGEGAYQPSDTLRQIVDAGAEVDWERGGFGGAAREATVWQPIPPVLAGSGDVAAAPDTDIDRLVAMFLAEASLGDRDIKNPSPDMILKAGRIIKKLVAGLVVMIEARARAKSQMGAETTNLSLEGNNPIKFTRTPEQALARLLSPAERGFMDGEEAVEDAFRDLQAHQVATLRAMQGALKTALNRFSPDAIRRRAEFRGIFARILPTARDAALWQNYEREFGLVAQESDEAFVEVFAKQFRKAYEQQIQKAKEGTGS